MKRKKDLLEVTDLTLSEMEWIFRRSAELKLKPFQNILNQKTIGLIFSKRSTRTRVSFEVGIHELGGRSLFLSPQEIQLGRGETVADTARVLSRYLDGVVIRTFAHKEIRDFAANADIPVINGLTDQSHPCQVFTDLFTILEKKGTLKGVKVVYFGDCDNNMAYSWMLGAGMAGVHLVLTGHEKYMPSASHLKRSQALAKKTGGHVEIIKDPKKAVKQADVVYCDVWTSMGQEEESEIRCRELSPWQVNSGIMKLASKKAIFMHCLPAHRGEEVTHEVLESKQSVVFDQAENRLHVQKAIMNLLMGL